MTWCPYESGATLGTTGSEAGSILRDEEHPAGSRITLERDTASAPFAITCGIYGSMFHTAFAGTEAEAATMYDGMKGWLERLLAPDLPTDEYHAMLRRFVDAYQ